MFTLQFMQNAFMAGILIGILCPTIGLFIVLKRYSMIGDTLSHSSFAGVAIGLVFGFNPLFTAFIFTSICALLIEFLRGYYKKYAELVMSIILTLSLGIAIVLVSSGKSAANINSYLFGSILTVTSDDLILIGSITIICLIVIKILYNKLVYITFDEEGAQTIGINVKRINYIFTLLIGATISASIRIMGILVISSVIVIPVATALQLKRSFKQTLFLSIVFALFDILSALVLSYHFNTAPGGTIALTSVIVLVITIIISSVNLKK